MPVLIDQLRVKLAGAIVDAIPALFEGLRSKLHEVLATARSLDADLGDLDTADPHAVAAATAEQRAAILALPDLARGYQRIRRAQRAAYGATGQHAPGWTDLSVDHDWSTDGRVDREAMRADIERVVRERPELGRYGNGPGQVARPDGRRRTAEGTGVGAGGATGDRSAVDAVLAQMKTER